MSIETKPSHREPEWRIERGRELLQSANTLFNESSDPALDPAQAERLARSALAEQVSAYNWLEDTGLENAVHDDLHSMGRDVRLRFPGGCTLTWSVGRYEHRCPVEIVHKRFGFSPTLIAGEKLCTICGTDISECEHMPGQIYAVHGGIVAGTGRCAICMEEQCEHDADTVYEARAGAFVTKIAEVEEISLVSRPKQPDARLVAVPIDGEVLREYLGEGFQYGKDTVDCSQCLSPCEGFTRLAGDPKLPSETQGLATHLGRD